MTQRHPPHIAPTIAQPAITPTPFKAPVQLHDDGQAVPLRPEPGTACSEQVPTEGRLCMSRDSEPWDSRHVVPEDDNAYGLRRVDDAAGHDTRHEGSTAGPP